MSVFRQCLGQRLRTFLFATLALALLNQSVFGLGCLPCSGDAGRDVPSVVITSQMDAPDSQPGDDCGVCCEVLPPGHCYGQAASMPLSLAPWHPGAAFHYAVETARTADPPSLLTERFRPPIH